LLNIEEHPGHDTRSLMMGALLFRHDFLGIILSGGNELIDDEEDEVYRMSYSD
jgi:hypothetical protein